MYSLINDFLLEHFFTDERFLNNTFTLFNNSINLREYLSNMTTIVIMFVGVVLCALLVRWFFKLMVNPFKRW